MTYQIVMEDAGQYLPHDPTGVEYRYYVYRDKRLVFSGARDECAAYVSRRINPTTHTGRLYIPAWHNGDA